MSNIGKALIILLIAFSLLSCSDNNHSTTSSNNNYQAEVVVRKMYVALATGDQDAYMDTILPANRRVLNPMNLVPALSVGGNVGVFGAEIDIGKLMKFSFKELNVRTVRSSSDYALVEARGIVRYPALGMEFNFCDQHDVRKENGHWYVDIYAPERQERVSRLLEKRQKEILSNPPTPSGDMNDPIGLIFSGIGQGMEQALDLCGE